MDNKLHFAYLSSAVIETYYIKLRELSYQNEEDSQEYEDTINKLKKATQGENEIYRELTDEDIDSAIKYFNENKPKNVTEVRMRSKLNRVYRSRHVSEYENTLGNIITSKIVIDVFKRLTYKILKLKSSELSEETIETLLLYNDIYKYNYLNGTDHIERIALEYKFDILSMPNIKFTEIEETFQIEFLKKSAEINFNYIKDSIEELLNIKTEDKYLELYITLLELSRVETMLPYLNKDMLIKLSDYLNNLNLRENNDILKKIRRIVDKRKEEFE